MIAKRATVAVVGGGPAGSTAGALLAMAGHDVLLLERDSFPRFHIGESLITETYWVFERLGVLERLKSSDFPLKYSVQFISENGNESRPFYFFERDPHESSVTWQVDRAEFDHMLLENARERGAVVEQGWKVARLVLEDGAVRGVRGVTSGGEEFEVRARVVVDATGLHSVAARQLGWIRKDPRLQKAAVYAHFENGRRDEGIDEGATLVIHTRGNRGWFWYIPLSRNRVSIGVVGAANELLKGRGALERILAEEIAACPAVATRLAAARRLGEVRATSDYTWRSSRSATDGLVLIGDAFGFLDPIYSSGVLLALKSGALAADTVAEALAADDVSAERLGRHGETLAGGMESFRKLVYAFYTPGFSFANFVREHPEHREQLVRILIGDVFSGGLEGLFDAMRAWCELPEEHPLSEV